jgi:hypothetical protein
MDLALRPAPRGGASTSGRMYGDRIPAGPRDPSLWSDSSTTTQMDPIWPEWPHSEVQAYVARKALSTPL